MAGSMSGRRMGAGRTAAVNTAHGRFMQTLGTIKRTPPTPESQTWPNMFTDSFFLDKNRRTAISDL
jgi:hypothetical protein